MIDRHSQQNLDQAILLELVNQYYQVQVDTLQQLPSPTGKLIYQVGLTDGTSWILRLTPAHDQAMLNELGQFLRFFEEVSYPAERVIPTTEGAMFTTVGDRALCMTTYLTGTPLDYSPTSFALLGTALGRLHALKPALTYTPPKAGMLPAGELAFARQQLTSIEHAVPHDALKQYQWLDTALTSITYGSDLPVTLIHNDCHPANALLSSPGQATLLDWEGAGMGSASIDVGFLLTNCDGKVPWDPITSASSQTEDTLIRSAIEGYCLHYRLTPAELDYLPDAIRFRSLVFGTGSFVQAIKRHERAAFSQQWWRRYTSAEEVAGKARMYF
ncbi:phosphotransferase enzyme family protein [Ktedonobacter racemifer]|uniref:Aminoglycoside phosphotransferase n=1 Tax=Ktedonobacter racemifer DSM 44963 TaxID=485913 RepID=D6TVT3_KTERA|nr:phosphotransferase [Ktedonobacter racemifer]EFH84316.1 aminoglycoside phosphotransferase [Ktedonobacter racemifer DSM 44963]